jgi:type IV pilus assembly protein PilX
MMPRYDAMKESGFPLRGERGTALVMGLVFLVILTLLGLSSSSGVIQQEIIARNVRDQNLALEAAEAALKTAEFWLRQKNGPAANGMFEGLPQVFDSRGAAPLCDGATTCEFASVAWWENNAIQLGDDVETVAQFPEVADQPYYIVELVAQQQAAANLGQPPKFTRHYQITARGTGLSSNTVRIVRSMYRFIS